MRLLTIQDAAEYRIRDLGGIWSFSYLECPQCKAVQTHVQKCRRSLKGRCKRLPLHHVHQVCCECGYCGIIPHWRI